MIPPAGTYTTTASNVTVTTSNNTGSYSVPFPPNHPNLVEFGKAFEMPLAAMDDPFLVQTAYDMVLKSYLEEKSKSFPTWSGLPDIKSNTQIDSLKRIVSVGWYVQVPKIHVIDQDQKEEEALWEE